MRIPLSITVVDNRCVWRIFGYKLIIVKLYYHMTNILVVDLPL